MTTKIGPREAALRAQREREAEALAVVELRGALLRSKAIIAKRPKKKRKARP